VNRTLYWITSSKFSEGHPHEESLYRVLAARGYRVVQRVWDRQALPALAEDEAIIVRTPWDYPGKIDVFDTWIDSLPGQGVHNPRAILKWNSDKIYLRELETEGVPLVPTHWLEAGSVEEVEKSMREAFSGNEKVIKPLRSAGAFHTYRFNEGMLPDASPFVGSPAMIQPFVREILSEGERSLVFFGGEFSHAIAKRPKFGDFRIQEEFGGCFSAFSPDASETDFAGKILEIVARKFAAALGGKPLLYSRVDYVRVAGEPKLMELELLEPDLYFHHAPGSPDRFEAALRRILD
jgi:hypothetical protein